jgi:hypothetical protein
MRRGIALPVAVLALALLGGCGDDDEQGFVIIGNWRGALDQRGLNAFQVTARIRDLGAPALNTVHYTGIDCDGHWTFLRRDDGAYRFREVIDRGAGGTCKGKGIVTLTPRGENTLGYRFRGGGVVSRGVIGRFGFS